MVKLFQQMMPKIEKLHEVDGKLEEVKNKKQESEKKLKDIEKKIEEIKASAQSADTPQKKAEADDLISQALALKSDAERASGGSSIRGKVKQGKEKYDTRNK